MGVIFLSDKSDYWNIRGLCTNHNPCYHMPFYRSKAIRSNIHLSPVGQENASEEYPEEETGNGDNTSSEEVLKLDVRWHSKESLLIDNVNKMLHHL